MDIVPFDEARFVPRYPLISPYPLIPLSLPDRNRSLEAEAQAITAPKGYHDPELSNASRSQADNRPFTFQ